MRPFTWESVSRTAYKSSSSTTSPCSSSLSLLAFCPHLCFIAYRSESLETPQRRRAKRTLRELLGQILVCSRWVVGGGRRVESGEASRPKANATQALSNLALVCVGVFPDFQEPPVLSARSQNQAHGVFHHPTKGDRRGG